MRTGDLFYVRLQICEKRLLTSSCPSVRMKLSSYWTDFDETSYLCFFFFRNSVEKIKISLKSDKNNWYFTWTLFTFVSSSRWILLRMRNILDKSYREIQNTRFIFSDFFPKIVPFMTVSKNMVEPERPKMSSQYGAYALHAGYAKLQARTRTRMHMHTHRICNIYCFSTTVVIRRSLILRYTYIACLVKILSELFLAGKKAQWDEDDGRILLGDNTDGVAITLGSIRLQCAGVCISIKLSWTRINTWLSAYSISTLTGPSGTGT
jgi:hypothetical protein